MYKKFLILAFFTGLLITAIYASVLATRGTQVVAPENTLIVQNKSPINLTFILETGTNRQTNLGSVASGEALTMSDSSTVLVTSADSKDKEYTIHAKDEKGGEFFTLLIDRDEVLARGSIIEIPGPGGRRQQAMLASKATVVPSSTSVTSP